MTRTTTHRFVAALSLLFVIALPLTALALSLAELRADGTVGERFTGYAVLHNANLGEEKLAEVKAKIDEINAQRRAIYEERAVEQGVTAEAVGVVYAGTIRDKAPVGTWFLDQGGAWSQKQPPVE